MLKSNVSTDWRPVEELCKDNDDHRGSWTGVRLTHGIHPELCGNKRNSWSENLFPAIYTTADIQSVAFCLCFAKFQLLRFWPHCDHKNINLWAQVCANVWVTLDMQGRTWCRSPILSSWYKVGNLKRHKTQRQTLTQIQSSWTLMNASFSLLFTYSGLIKRTTTFT